MVGGAAPAPAPVSVYVVVELLPIVANRPRAPPLERNNLRAVVPVGPTGIAVSGTDVVQAPVVFVPVGAEFPAIAAFASVSVNRVVCPAAPFGNDASRR